MARKTGWHHSEKTRKAISDRNKGKHFSPATEFKKGNVPWNTGLKRKGMRYAYHNSSCTKFKRGSQPANWKPVGTVVIRIDTRGMKVPWIKVEEPNKWEYLARYVWKKSRGKEILPGFVIYHLDANHLNNEPENLVHIPRALAIAYQRIDNENMVKNAMEARDRTAKEWRLAHGGLND